MFLILQLFSWFVFVFLLVLLLFNPPRIDLGTIEIDEMGLIPSDWVDDSVALHSHHKSGRCPYCDRMVILHGLGVVVSEGSNIPDCNTATYPDGSIGYEMIPQKAWNPSPSHYTIGLATGQYYIECAFWTVGVVSMLLFICLFGASIIGAI